VEHFSKSIGFVPNARAYFGRGTCLAALRRREEAEEALREALSLAPTMVGAYVNLAGMRLAKREYEEAAALCRRALEFEPGGREATMNLANALRNLGRREEAVELVWQHIDVERRADSPTGARAPPLAIDCEAWRPSTSSCSAPTDTAERSDAGSPGAAPLAVVCVKWGARYGAEYVNRLFAGVRRHLPGMPFDFICFTDDAEGLEEEIESRPLPGGLQLWWGKAYLFSDEAGLDGRRVLFLDLDQVVVGSLAAIAAYRGAFAILGTEGIACELAAGGYNSSVMAWEASPFFRPVYSGLDTAALKFVHRFDHWLEMTVAGADLWQALLPGRVVDYTTVFRGGRCMGSAAEEASLQESLADGSFATEVAGEADARGALGEPPPDASVVTFPRYPKPHEVLELHPWVRRHWLGDPG